MRLLGISTLSALAGVCAPFLQGESPSTPTVRPNFKLPLAFERQSEEPDAVYVARGQGYMVAIQDAKTTIGILPGRDQAGSAISMEFARSRHAQGTPGAELPGKVNYIRGNDASQWKLGLPTYGRVTYQEIYPGIDVVYHGNQQQLEFDLILKPGADHGAVRMKLAGARKISLDPAGQLVLETLAGELRIPLPQIYQETGGKKNSIAGHYKVCGNHEVAFEVASYDRTKPLVIDPTIVYGFLIGGNTNTSAAQAVAVDSGGNVYTCGYTFATDFPITSGVAQTSYAGDGDAFISKVNPSGTALLYSTYLGGTNFDAMQAIAVDSAGAAWVAGYSNSPNFPVKNQFQGTLGGGYDAVIAKLSSSGTLVFSTYLGGSSNDLAYGIAVDTLNNAYVTGYTGGPFPATVGSGTVQGPTDAFVAKFAPSGTLSYSTLVGGSGQDLAFAIAADSSGAAYITGSTFSISITGAPSGGARSANAGAGDAFVAKLNPTGTALVYFTFLGGSLYDQGTAIALDTGLNAYVGGFTQSPDLNPTAGVVQSGLSGGINGFAAKLNNTGSVFNYITYLGGEREDYLQGLAYDSASGGVYVTGYTDSSQFPLISPVEAFSSSSISAFQSTNSGGSWGKLDSNIQGAVTGISVDPANSSTLVITTEAGIYRTTNNGANWTQEIAGLGFTISRSPVLGFTDIIFAMNAGQAYLSADGGATWRFQGSTQTGTTNVIADPGNCASNTACTAYAFSYNGSAGVQKTTDGGQTWSVFVASGLPSALVYGMGAALPSPGAATGSLYAAVSGFGVYVSTNQVATWSSVSSGLPVSFNAAFTQYNSTLSVVQNGNASLPVVAYIVVGGTIYKTTDGGASWAATAGSVPNGATNVSAQTASVVYASSKSGTPLYISTDGGTTWNAMSIGLGDSSIQAVAFDPTNSARVFALAAVTYTAFVAKLNATANTLTYSTYLGSLSYTYGYGIATNSLGDAFVAGSAYGVGFPKATASIGGTVGFVAEISDSTAGYTIVSPTPGSVLAYPSQTFTWTTTPGADEYWLDVGSQVAKGDYFAAAIIGTSFNVTTLPCDGRTIYVQVWAHVSGAWQTPNRYTYTAISGCAALTAPIDNATFPGSSVTFSWPPATGADQYWVDVGNTIGKGDIFASAIAGLGTAVNNIPCDGRTIYVQLWTHLDGAWQNPGRYIYTAANGACGGSSGITSPVAGSVLTSPSQTFNWSTVAGADQYWLDVGSQLAQGDYFGAATTGTSFTVTSMPCDGRMVYVQLWNHIGGVWQSPQRTTYTGASGCAALTSPADGTVFTTTSATFNWSAAAGADEYWLERRQFDRQGRRFCGADHRAFDRGEQSSVRRPNHLRTGVESHRRRVEEPRTLRVHRFEHLWQAHHPCAGLDSQRQHGDL